ncbi:MAG: hypothetical protein U0800_26635, partial [Isosphaeraceae bacterium]
VYIRPPKPLPGQAADFRLVPGLTDAQYDLRSSFVSLRQDGGLDLGLHVLARHKKPPRPAAKGGAPAEPDQSQRGDFTNDVLTLLNTVHNNAASTATSNKARAKGGNEFNRYIYEANGNKIQVYLLPGRKVGQDVFDLALIWELSPEQQKNPKPVDLCLQTVAVGPAATRAFNGQADDTGIEGQEQPGPL